MRMRENTSPKWTIQIVQTDGKNHEIDISGYIEAAIVCGIAVACNLVGRQRVDVLRRMDRDDGFCDRAAKLISLSMMKSAAASRSRAEDDAALLALVGEIIAEAEKMVPSA